MLQTTGIHHITAIAGDPQENVDFYAGVLGLRLVKTTVNFDDPGTYHLYFGNDTGEPGTIMTFFPWSRAPRGRIGAGQVGVIHFAIPPESMDFWQQRLQDFRVDFYKETRFGEDVLHFNDPHGLALALVERNKGANSRWTFGNIPHDAAIKGFAGATLLSEAPEKTTDLLLNLLELEKVNEEENMIRLRTTGDIGNTIDVSRTQPRSGQMGAGTVHHIAFRTHNYENHEQWRQLIAQYGLAPTPIIDRQYFKSIYFRETGGILFEMATDIPGFLTDESETQLGQHLKLPPQYEPYRKQLEQKLTPITVRSLDGDQT